MKAIIIDDEPMIREDLRYLLGKYDNIEIIGEAGTVAAAEKLLKELHADVVFLDIQLLGGTGFDLVPHVPPSTRIIFFTSYEEYAVRAFEVNALDYLLKPVSAERLAESLARLDGSEKQRSPAAMRNKSFKKDDRVHIRTDRERRFVDLPDILAATSAGGNYSFIHLLNGNKYMVRKTLKKWEQILPMDLFLRVHRAVIIRLSSIESIRQSENGSHLAVIAETGKTFPVSRRALDRLKKSCLHL